MNIGSYTIVSLDRLETQTMKTQVIIAALAYLVATQPGKAETNESDSKQLWYGVGLGAVATLCNLLEEGIIDKKTVSAKLASMQEPSPDADIETVKEVIRELRSDENFKDCLD